MATNDHRKFNLDWAEIAASGTWFMSLPQPLQEWLLGHGEVRSLSMGQQLFGRGDPQDGMYCVGRGLLRISSVTEHGQEALLSVVEPPEWIGEIGLFDGLPRTHDAWADSDVLLLHIPHTLLMDLLSAQPAYWCHFGRLLTHRLRLLFSAIEDIALLPPTARLARRLANMAMGYGHVAGRSKRVLKVSQEELGLMLGLSRQTVNQSLGELEAGGSIRRNRGSIEIVDAERLSAAAPK